MVGHQTVRPDLDLVGAAPVRHEFDVTLVIFVRKKGLLPAVAALGDMMGQARCDDTCQSSHNRRVAITRPAVNNCVWCPRNSGTRPKLIVYHAPELGIPFSCTNSWHGRNYGQQEIAATLNDPTEVDEEIRWLFEAVRT